MKVLKLFSTIVIVKGFSRSIMIDFNKGNSYFVPNSLVSLIDENNIINYQGYFYNASNEQKSILDEYLNFLIAKDLAFYCTSSEIDNFPLMDNEFHIASHVSNAIIEFGLDFKINAINDLIHQLENLLCYHVQFKFLSIIPSQEIDKILIIVKKSKFKSIDLFLSYDHTKNIKYYKKLINDNRKIQTLYLFNSDEFKILDFDDDFVGNIVFLHTIDITHKFCGKVYSDYFAPNIPHYTESLAHNTCLNRKIAIDAEGNIKNCPSMKESYGNIRDTTLEEAINKPGFKKYWDIKKDDITKCRDCEFRHICTDCRAYVDEPEYATERAPSPSGRAGEGLYSAPLKCGYNPYTCEWEEWSTHPLKQQAIDYYEMRDIL